MNDPDKLARADALEASDLDHRAINRGMVGGAAWMVAMRIAIRLIGMVSTIILARLLVPADFGLVAIATMIHGLIAIMSEFGFDVVLIQKQDIQRDYYDTAWTLSIIRGLVTAAILVSGAPITAAFFDDERLIDIMYVLGLVALISGVANIGIVDFRKSLNFKKDFQYLVSVKIISFFATVGLAVVLRSYWALVIGIASGTLAGAILSYIMHPFRPRWSFSRWREIMHFSKWLLINNILIFANQKSDSFIVGKVLGVATLGLYTVAYEIATMATSELIAPIRRALLPGYSKLAQDPTALARSFVQGLALILLIGAPVAVGIGLVADPLVRLVLGAKWLDVIPMLQILAIFGLFQVSCGNAGTAFLAMGRPRLVMLVIAFTVGIGAPLALFATLRWGITGTLWSLVATNFAAATAWLVLGVRVMKVSPASLFAAVWRTLVALAAMTIAVWLVADAFSETSGSESLMIMLGTEVLTGALVYIGVQFLLWRLVGSPDGPEKWIYDLVSARLRRTVKLAEN